MNSTAEHLLSLSRKAGWHCCVIPHPALPFTSHLQGCGAYLHMQPFFLSLSCHNGSGGHTKGAVCSLSWKVRAGVLLMHTPVQIRWWLRGLLIGRVEVHHSINKSIKLHSTVAHHFNQNQMWRCADFPSIHCLTPFVLYLDSVTHTSPSPSHSTWTRMFLDESTQKKNKKTCWHERNIGLTGTRIILSYFDSAARKQPNRCAHTSGKQRQFIYMIAQMKTTADWMSSIGWQALTSSMSLGGCHRQLSPQIAALKRAKSQQILEKSGGILLVW